MIELKNSKKTYLGKSADGKRNRFALDCHIGAVQMKEDGVWWDIDPTLDKNVLSKRVPYIVTPYLTGMPGFHYKSKQSGEFDIRIRSAKSLSLPDSPTLVANIPVPVIEGKRIIWQDVYPDTDVVLLHRNTGLTLQRIIKSINSPLEYDVDIEVIKEGIAQILPLGPASDASGQALMMEETKIARGRTERLKLEVIRELSEIEPQLITYPIKDATIVEEQVGASYDDAFRQLTTSSYSRTDNYNRAGAWDGSFYQQGCGMRFQTVAIPNGVTINWAHLQITARLSDSGTVCNTRVSAEGVDDAAEMPSSSATFDTRWAARTAARVDWDGIVSWTADSPYDSADIATVIKEIVDRPGWASGQDIVIFWEDFDNRSTLTSGNPSRRGRSWDDDSAKAPELHIEYEAVAGWANNFIGVANASIGTVTGTSKASIGKVNGVA